VMNLQRKNRFGAPQKKSAVTHHVPAEAEKNLRNVVAGRAHLNFASIDFTASAALQGICGSKLQLYALRLAYTANSTLAKFR